MQSWKHESLFAEYIAEEDLVATSLRAHRRHPSINPSERKIILQSTTQALQNLQSALAGQDLELHWVNQLLTYVQRLHNLDPASTAEEQFNQLYYLRKWLFWVPVSLLQQQRGQGPAMLTLSYFYATAMALEPLFPDLGSSFCGAIALPPLETIIGVMNTMRPEHSANTGIATLMQFPRQTALSYRSRATLARPSIMQPSTMINISPDTLSYASIGNMSPAFAPSPLHYTPQSASTSYSPWLQVPSMHAGFSYGTESWGATSPGFPAHDMQEEQMYGYMSSTLGGQHYRGGFVPTPIWT